MNASISDKPKRDRAKDSGERCTPFLEALRAQGHLVFDGAMGSVLMAAGLKADEAAELLCITEPDTICAIHRRYVEAGADVVTTNTFGANKFNLEGKADVADVYAAAVKCARDSGARFVAGCIGPTGEMLEPFGDLEDDEAYSIFAEQAKAIEAAVCDVVVIETMADLNEASIAVRAVAENCSAPIIATMTFGEHGKTLFGVSPQQAVRELERLGVVASGINCSLGPSELKPLVAEMLEVATRPVIVQPNAGVPSMVAGQTVYGVGPDEFAEAIGELVDMGVSIVGGCCGTDPRYTEKVAALFSTRKAS